MADDKIPYTMADYLDVVRRRWIYIAMLLPAAILISVYIAFALPPIYRSSGTILLEAATVPEELVRSTVTTLAGQQIELVQRRVMTNDNLTRLVEEFDPYPDELDLSNTTKARLVRENTLIEKVDPVTLEPLAESSAFSIHYHNQDAAIAAQVADRLVAYFLDYNRASRTERASETYQFLQTQSQEVEQRVATLEQGLADFKTRYGDAIPEAQVRNIGALDRAERDLDGYQQQLRLAEERKALLELQLSGISRNIFSDVGNWQTELALMRAELAEAQRRYTDDHPDVRRLKRSIAALSERAATDSGAPQSRPDNPEYLRFANQLQAANDEIASLRANIGRARQQIGDYEQRLQMAPDVEREYRQLVRNHEIAQDQYREIKNKLSEAELAQTLESENQGSRLTLIIAPGQPSSPYSPNRVGIIMLGIVLGGALAAIVVAIRDSSDPSIRSVRDLATITDIKPIGAIPFMLNRADQRRRSVIVSVAAVVVGVAMLMIGSAIVQASSL